MGILAILGVLMIYSAAGARKVGTAQQTLASAQQNARMLSSIIERDLRDAGSDLYVNVYRAKNGGTTYKPVGEDSPDTFDYSLGSEELEGVMIPPIEVTNDTDDDPNSYLNPVALSMNLTNSYREYGTDLITLYATGLSEFSANIDEYTGLGQEMIEVTDPKVGARLMKIWEKLGEKPILVMMIDDQGAYSTFRTITNVRKSADVYQFDLNPSNDYNQPTDFKGFLEDIGYSFLGEPAKLREMVGGDWFSQVSVVTYFVYTHPDPGKQAEGWFVRIDMPAVTANAMDVDASDPDTIRPFVVADHVSDFQVALGVDTNTNGVLDAGEWHNSEDMEDYSHLTTGDGSVNAQFTDLINNLLAVRYSIVTYTDQTAEDDPYGFIDRDSPEFYTNYSDVNDVANLIGISPTLEDRQWDSYSLAYRLWYRRAVQQTRVAKIRNLDLENTFARTQ
jgi:hypothetical protein